MLKYIKEMSKQVYLHRKYKNTINHKINMTEEIKNIQRNKSSYRKWINQPFNSTMNNSNLQRYFCDLYVKIWLIYWRGYSWRGKKFSQ